MRNLVANALRYLLSLVETDSHCLKMKDYALMIEDVLARDDIAFNSSSDDNEISYEITGKGGLACWMAVRSTGTDEQETTLAVCIPFASIPDECLLPFYRSCLEQNEYLIGCALSVYGDRLRVVSERETTGLDRAEIRNLIFQSFDTAYRKGRLMFDEFGAEPLFRVNWTRQQTNSSIPLCGDELLNKVRSLGDVSKSDLVRACGYSTQRSDGTERLNFTAFYEALLEAKGVELAPEGVNGITEDGRQLSYICSMRSDRSLILTKAYTLLLNLLPGDEFYVFVDQTSLTLRLFDSNVTDQMRVTVDENNNIFIPPHLLSSINCPDGQDFEIKLSATYIRLVLID